MVHADRPGAPLPTRAASAFSKSPVEMPFRQRIGISTSRLFDRRAYRGRIDGEYRMRSPSAASRSRTRGWRTATGPMPVMISRSGRWPWRTTRWWPVAVLRSAYFARNSATSASTAWVSSARAPLRRTSVKESVKTPGWASLITLLSDTAYRSFIGEVEALTPPRYAALSGHAVTNFWPSLGVIPPELLMEAIAQPNPLLLQLLCKARPRAELD